MQREGESGEKTDFVEGFLRSRALYPRSKPHDCKQPNAFINHDKLSWFFHRNRVTIVCYPYFVVLSLQNSIVYGSRNFLPAILNSMLLLSE